MEIIMFDENTQKALKHYVYALIDPRNSKVFYIGKGQKNRVFDHIKASESSRSLGCIFPKLEKIKSIQDDDLKVKHVIVRHGLSEDQAFRIEATLIDFLGFLGEDLTNEVAGHHSMKFGVMASEQIMQIYNAKPLLKIDHNAVIININKSYDRAKGGSNVYESTKESWVISKSRRSVLEYALSEYRGIIVEVYKINKWYQCSSVVNKPERWGFDGTVAAKEVRDLYINKSISHIKKPGAANPIRYNI
jgi:hypothetical protein